MGFTSESTLKKKHNAIAHHQTREEVAAGTIRVVTKEDGKTNLADVLTKPLRKLPVNSCATVLCIEEPRFIVCSSLRAGYLLDTQRRVAINPRYVFCESDHRLGNLVTCSRGLNKSTCTVLRLLAVK